MSGSSFVVFLRSSKLKMEIFLEGVALVGSLGIKSFNQAFKMIEESDGAFVPLTNGLRLKYDEASGCFVIENPEASLSAPVCPVSRMLHLIQFYNVLVSSTTILC